MSEQTSSTEQTSVVAEAERVLRELEDRRRVLVERKVEIDEKRKRLAYCAVAERDAAAVKSLAHLSAEANKHASEMDALLAASTEAEHRLLAARQAEAEIAAKKTAVELREAVKEFVACGEFSTRRCRRSARRVLPCARR